ncbi:MAG: L-histidine N(alpha)-methyltransferase [Elusimicrobia bacterium]|nr:L-histidine N(alpha)-methyltransferase [Elusimicrobiota bacterium]
MRLKFHQDNLKITATRRPKIVSKLKRENLRQFYKQQLARGLMHPAQWFSDATKWYQIHTFNNPYNIGRPNAELALLLDSKKPIAISLKDFPLVFWGVGKADTEMEIVNLQLDDDAAIARVVAIDINYRFLKDFSNALRDKIKENGDVITIYFLGIKGLFESVCAPELNCFDGSKMHVCLGNTIGNYDEIGDILRILQKNMNIGDHLLLGFQSDRLVQSTIRRYTRNPYLESLFLSSLPRSDLHLVKERGISWKYNPEKQQIEAWVGSIQVFRSKKFNPDGLRDTMKAHGFVLSQQFTDKYTTYIHIYDYRGAKNAG